VPSCASLTYQVAYLLGIGCPTDRPRKPIGKPNRRPFDEVSITGTLTRVVYTTIRERKGDCEINESFHTRFGARTSDRSPAHLIYVGGR
jgi:hypothetical protein